MSRKTATDWIVGAMLVLLTGGVTWAASAIVDHGARIAVEESTTKDIRDDIKEIKDSLKELLRR